ncbi:MAG: FHA domain-containing protein [Verrucomicrobiales bacterium]
MALFLKPTRDGLLPDEAFAIPDKQGEISVGRDETNDLRISHASVSSRHARLEISETNGVDVVDCDSIHGTFVNGERIDKRPIKHGDVVKFASAEFQVAASGNGVAAPEAEASHLRKRLEEAESKIRELEAENSEKASGVAALNAELASEREKNAEMRRDLQAGTAREEKLETRNSEAREEILNRERTIASLHFELSRQDKLIDQSRKSIEALETEKNRLIPALEESAAIIADQQRRMERAGQETENARATVAAVVERLESLAERLLDDWKAWLDEEDSPEEGSGSTDSVDGVFDRIERVAVRIRAELDAIEPIWHAYGEGVQAELKARCDELSREQAILSATVIRKREALEKASGDLDALREEMDREIRRAQRLSRRGNDIEIPERFEAMVIAKDREQEICRALAERVEVFDQLLEGYRKSRKLREVSAELEEFREKLVAILVSNGVEAFYFEPGTELTLKHRKEVQVVGRKGWGTREHYDQPFQPGRVASVVRPGYRMGKGDQTVVLRKVEVLIREAEH